MNRNNKTRESYLDEFMDVTVGSGEICGVLEFEEDDEVQIVPHVVFLVAMLLERNSLVVK